MKKFMLVLVAVALLPMLGCNEANPAYEKNQEPNQQIVRWYYDSAISNAIISQHTVFPYLFERNGAALNDLGKRDVAVLATHYKKNPGNLNIRQGGVSDELYEARTNTVMEQLVAAGVDQERINVLDGLAGGDGGPSERVIVVMQQKSAAQGIYQGDTVGSD